MSNLLLSNTINDENKNNTVVYFDNSDLFINKLKSLPLLSKSTNLLINTGNIVSSNRIKKKSNLISNDEIYECIQTSLVNWLLNSNETKIQVRERRVN